MAFRKMEGEIGYYGLSDWWLATFSEDERHYIDERYQPMGAPPHHLTQGKILSSRLPAATFLNGLNSWFRSPEDKSIFLRIHEKIVELGETQPVHGLGYLKGRHFTTFVTDVENLKKSDRIDDAEKLLIELVNATEAEDKERELGVAPWYYEELAKIYRKQKIYEKEVSILERFAERRHAPGKKPEILLERLEKAKNLVHKEGGS